MTTFVNLTILHKRYDPRIFIRIACTLSDLGFGSELWVRDELEDEIVDGVKISSFGGHNGLVLFFNIIVSVYRKRPTFLIIHDPILLMMAPFLLLSRTKLIFDSHEDVPEDILIKPYIPKNFRPLISTLYKAIEVFICRVFVCSVFTPSKNVSRRMTLWGISCHLLNNYPTKNIIYAGQKLSEESQPLRVIFLGAMSTSRNIQFMIDGSKGINGVELVLVGPVSDVDMSLVLEGPTNENISYLGYMRYEDALLEVDKSDVGLVLPLKSKISEDAYPVKMFEYLARGLYVLGSDFGVIKEVLFDRSVGNVIDLSSPNNLRASLEYLRDNRGLLGKAAILGPKLVSNQFCFEAEFSKVLKGIL